MFVLEQEFDHVQRLHEVTQAAPGKGVKLGTLFGPHHRAAAPLFLGAAHRHQQHANVDAGAFGGWRADARRAPGHFRGQPPRRSPSQRGAGETAKDCSVDRMISSPSAVRAMTCQV
jgi:hypothetical protein